MFGGILGASLLYTLLFEGSHNYFYGKNGQGGAVLDLYSTNSDYDIAYNREFQRMCYLAQVSHDSSNDVSNETLAALGGKVATSAPSNVHKLSPHFKYF